jgi:hypothetical protein
MQTALNNSTIITDEDQNEINNYLDHCDNEEYEKFEKKLVDQGDIQPENENETPESDLNLAEEDEKEHQRIQNMLQCQQFEQPPVNVNYQPSKIYDPQNKLCIWGDDCHGRLSGKCPYHHPNLKPAKPKSSFEKHPIKKCNFGDKCRKKGKGCPYLH